MKRVIPFFDMFDEIPDNAKYLFSNKVEIEADETEEQKSARIISGNPESNNSANVVTLHQHFYEVDDMDMDELMESGFKTKTPGDKIKEFQTRYKIPSK